MLGGLSGDSGPSRDHLLTGPAICVTLRSTTPPEEPGTPMFLQQFITILFRALEFAILIRVVLSWISPMQQTNPIFTIIWQITEPILGPLRRYTTFGMMDFSPIIALVGLQLLEPILLRLLAGIG
jgi:YggT family protein